MRNYAFLIITFLVTAGFSVASAQAPAAFKAGPRAEIFFADTDLAGSITVSDPKFRKVGAFTQTQFEIRSQRAEPLTLEHKVEWLDEDGFDVAGPTVAWQVAHLPAGGAKAVQSTGRAVNAHAIRVTIRYASQ